MVLLVPTAEDNGGFGKWDAWSCTLIPSLHARYSPNYRMDDLYCGHLVLYVYVYGHEQKKPVGARSIDGSGVLNNQLCEEVFPIPCLIHCFAILVADTFAAATASAMFL